RIVVRHRSARVRAFERAAGRSSRGRIVSDVHREGEQGADRPARRRSLVVDCAISAAKPPRAPEETLLTSLVRQRTRRAAQPHRVLEDSEVVWTSRAPATLPQSARGSTLVCDASARARGGSARHSDDARSCRSLDDTDLHPRPRGSPARYLRSLPSAPVILINLTVFPGTFAIQSLQASGFQAAGLVQRPQA